jgi:hypothetical protein
VILSDIGGAREMIEDGVEGYVVSATNSARASRPSFPRLYADRRKRQGMGAAARARAVSRFSMSGWQRPIAVCFKGSCRHECRSHCGPAAEGGDPATARIARRAVKVLQMGPALDVRGGVSSVEQLICDYLPSYASIRHVPTMTEGTEARKERPCSPRRLHAVLVHCRTSMRPSCTSTSHRAAARCASSSREHGAARRASVDPARAWRGLRQVPIAACPRRCEASSCRTLQQASVLIALSSQWRDFYVHECEVSPSQVVVLPNPVRVPARVPDRSGRAQVQFLHLGRLGRRKGGYDLVNAFRRLAGGCTRPREARAGRRSAMSKE